MALTTNYFYSCDQALETIAYGSGLSAAAPILSGRDTPTSPHRLSKKMTNQNRERPLRASLKIACYDLMTSMSLNGY